jgi:hypothetical protein
VKRIFFGLLALAPSIFGACGGRTTLDDSDFDGSVGQDGGVIGNDAGPIQIDTGPVMDAMPPDFDGGPPPPIDAGPPPPSPIQCGTSSCDPQTEVCCVTFNGQTINEACTAQGKCSGASLGCTSAASCPSGEVCCGTFTQTEQDSKCQTTCGGGFQHPQLCATNAECPSGTTCKNSPFGLKVCRP